MILRKRKMLKLFYGLTDLNSVDTFSALIFDADKWFPAISKKHFVPGIWWWSISYPTYWGICFFYVRNNDDMMLVNIDDDIFFASILYHWKILKRYCLLGLQNPRKTSFPEPIYPTHWWSDEQSLLVSFPHRCKPLQIEQVVNLIISIYTMYFVR